MRQKKSSAEYADQVFSMVDAVSFAIMQQRGIIEAFGFDRHFVTPVLLSCRRPDAMLVQIMVKAES